MVFAVGRMFHPNLIRYLGMAGDFDGFWIDVEHGGLTTYDIESRRPQGWHTVSTASSGSRLPTTPR